MRFIKIVLVLIVCLFICNCKKSQEEIDREIRMQEKQQEIFFKCLANIPKGPESTVTNDWDEVVDKCNCVAYNLSHISYTK